MTLRKGSIYVSLGAGVRLVLSLLSVPVLMRLLGAEIYGVWMLLGSILGIAMILELGTTIALTNRLSAAYARHDWSDAGIYTFTSLVMITALGMLTSAVLVLASPTIAAALFPNPLVQSKATPALGILAWAALPRFWQQWAVAIEAAENRFDIQAGVETAGAIVMTVGVILLAVLRADLSSFAWWYLVATGLVVLRHCLALASLLGRHAGAYRVSLARANDLFRFGIVQWFSTLGSVLFGQADRLIVGFLLGPASAGLYSAGTAIAVKINDLSAIPLQVVPAAVSAAHALRDQQRVRAIFIQAVRINGVAVHVLATSILYWSYPLATVLVEQEHTTQVSTLLQILAVAYGLYSLNAAGFFVAIGTGLQSVNARWVPISGGLTCIALFILVPLWGLAGAAWANVVYALTLAINLEIASAIQVRLAQYLMAVSKPLLLMAAWWMLCMAMGRNGYPLGLMAVVFVVLESASILYLLGPGSLRQAVATVSSRAERLYARHE